MTARDVRRYCRLAEPAEVLLRQAIAKLGLSARAYSRVLKVARTIAGLANESEIDSVHVSEAIQYRSLDRARLPAGGAGMRRRITQDLSRTRRALARSIPLCFPR